MVSDMNTLFEFKRQCVSLVVTGAVLPPSTASVQLFSNPFARVEVYLKRTLHVRTLPCVRWQA